MISSFCSVTVCWPLGYSLACLRRLHKVSMMHLACPFVLASPSCPPCTPATTFPESAVVPVVCWVLFPLPAIHFCLFSSHLLAQSVRLGNFLATF